MSAKIEYEVYEARDGSLWINIGDKSYYFLNPSGNPGRDIHGELPGVELDARQLAFVRQGDYGPVAQAWAAAHDEWGITPRFGYRGIVNSLGDHADVFPAFNPRPRDFGRS